MKIVIATNHDNGKGLQADAYLLRRALEERGRQVLFAHTERDKTAPPCDLIIFLETVRPGMFPASSRRWVMPNLEWWNPDLDLTPFEKILCKTRDCFDFFRAKTDRAVFTGWLSEEVSNQPKERKVLHVAGGSSAKGTAAVIEAWRRNPDLPPLEVVSSVWRGATPRRVQVHRQLPDHALKLRQGAFALHLQPSEYEGFGHAIREAMSAGGILLVPEKGPLGEIASAIKIPVSEQKPSPHGRAALASFVKPEEIAQAVRLAMTMQDSEIKELSEKTQAEWQAGQRYFMNTLDQLLDLPPRLSIVFPVHLGGLHLAANSVLALASQTDKRFEVVVPVDGPGLDEVGEAMRALDGPGLSVRVVHSPRPEGREEKPCRNHARNAGWRAARAPLVAIIDCDFILRPNFVEHVLAEFDTALAFGKPAVFTFCLAGIAGIGPNDWKDKGVRQGDDLEGMFTGELDHGIHSGFADQMTRPDAPFSSPLGDLPEGMPILPKGLWEAMGGFDEAFGEWGADKEEFIDRLKGLAREGLFEVRLIRSTCGLHQPHERDPDAWTKPAEGRQKERARRLKMIMGRSAWWRTQADNIRDRMPEIWAGFSKNIPSPSSPLPRMEVSPEGQAPLEFLAKVSGKLSSKIGRDRGRCAVFGRWGESVVQELISKGGDAYLETVEGLSGRDPGTIRQIVVVDFLNKTTEAETERFAGIVKAIRGKSGISMFVLEPTTMGGARGERHPIYYQRLFGRLSVTSKFTVDGRSCTLFCGTV